MIPNILSIAGSDPSGGAGIQADIKAISANGGYAMAAITALTAQNTCGVGSVHLVDPKMVAEQISMIRTDITVHAIKIGMLGSAAIAQSVADALAGIDALIVLDPVMVAKSGDRLLAADAVDALRRLLPIADVITPNLPEAADLLGITEATTTEMMEEQARALLELRAKAVFLKGGHLSAQRSPDLLVNQHSSHWLDGPRHPTANTHGTGCTLSSALATKLGCGVPLRDAARRAKDYVANAIANADLLSVGQGYGPTHHFRAFSNKG